MNTQDTSRDLLLQDIVERELLMFQAVANEGGPAACQQQPDAFRVMRWMAHSIHSDATLLSYQADLKNAVNAGRNLMTEKYARMDNRIPPLSHNPYIDAIALAEAQWLEEAAQRYPHALKGSGGEIFRRYIACELETLSDQTLECYFQEVQDARRAKRNLVEDRHDLLCRRLGYASLAAREASLAGEAVQS